MTAQFFDLMVDIEAMGTTPDAALMQIGAVFFDLQTMTMGPQFLMNVHLATAVRDGGVIEPATVLWWLGQSDEARKVRFNGVDIKDVLREFKLWVLGACRLQDVRPWGNSASFDLGIIGSAYRRAGIEPPWRWSNERCFRTVRRIYPQVEYNFEAKGDGAHNALVDAQFQVEHLFKIKRAVAAHQATLV